VKNFLNLLLVSYEILHDKDYHFIGIVNNVVDTDTSPMYGYVFPMLSEYLGIICILLILLLLLVVILIALSDKLSKRQKVISIIVSIVVAIIVCIILIYLSTWTMPIEQIWWH
jgi:glucan phosphoethanolaminetransferase (alkaline phosphatase superfamily)